MSLIKSEAEIKQLREGGKILSSVLKKVAKQAKAGVTTNELNDLAERLILMAGGEPSFKGYGESNNPYPATLCTSVNDEIVHGIPSDYILQKGDIVSLDVGMKYPRENGLYTDMSVTVPIGKIDRSTKNLIKVTKQSLDIWLKNIKAGKNLNDIAKLVQNYIEINGFSVVRDLVGHGVGHDVHEEPQIPNYDSPHFDLELKEGMVLALEPMVCLGDYRIREKRDGWTYATLDGSLSAHFEHTIAVTKGGCVVITK
ncbi:type I methionyl aminopeptidase [Candidatus Falkowbacteria bacterium]|jgi:methionyl aminopeptidase|nr:type I methionyl aminopeptidase [Candidatus Falkowbacteria bacterium]MBT7007156.1 type I methionyl aminopeptidase [Candidatus Falkowbacteria bacterium]